MRCDWLPERSRWSDLSRSGLPVASELSIESLIHKQCNISFHFLVVLGETLTKMFSTFALRNGKGHEIFG